MSSGTIIPVAKALYLCDYTFGYENGKTDLYGIFRVIRPENGYPHCQERFCVFAQLGEGLGQMGYWIDVREEASNQLIRTSHIYQIDFPHRDFVHQISISIDGCVFPRPGRYLLEAYL